MMVIWREGPRQYCQCSEWFGTNHKSRNLKVEEEKRDL
jgi:hypothetical protein